SRSVTKTWTVTDNCGKTGINSQTVYFTRDTALPVITLAAASALPCNPTAAQIAAAFGSASVSDNCSSGLVASGTVGAEQGTGCSRSVTKTWTVTDNCGKTGINSQTVYFTRDTEAPLFSGLPPATTNYQCYADVPAAPTVTANDICSGPVIPTYNETQSNPGSSCNNIIKRCWIAVDGCKNTNRFTQTITVNDTTKPLLTCPGPKDVVGAGARAITGLAYSETSATTITLTQLKAEGGDASGGCGALSI